MWNDEQDEADRKLDNLVLYLCLGVVSIPFDIFLLGWIISLFVGE